VIYVEESQARISKPFFAVTDNPVAGTPFTDDYSISANRDAEARHAERQRNAGLKIQPQTPGAIRVRR
jgi:hypothetical protein